MVEFLKIVSTEVRRVKVGRWSAALAFYAISALAPTLLIMVSVSGWLFGQTAGREQLLRFFGERLGDKALPLLEGALLSLEQSGFNLFFSAVGLLILSYGLYHFFNTLKESFLVIFGAHFDRGRNWSGTFLNYLKSFGLTGFLLLMIVGLILSQAAAPWLFSWLWGALDFAGRPILNLFWTFCLTLGFLTLIYRLISVGQIDWRSALVGGSFGALFFLILNILLSLYFSLFETAHAVYGASGALVALLLWVYYSTRILLWGGVAARAFKDFYARK